MEYAKLTSMELPEGYLPLKEAAELAKVSEKTVRNWVERKQVGMRKYKGRALYNRSDLDTQIASRAEMTLVKAPPAQVLTEMAGALGSALAEEFRRVLPRATDERIPLADLACKRYLTFPEAARLDGRSERFLRFLARETCVLLEGHGPRGCDLIRRTDLERI